MGTYIDQYAKLPDYCVKMRRTNLGTTMILKTELVEDKAMFQRIYIYFDACKRGFLSRCRRLDGFDGCHIKGPHPGQLLTVVSIDPNNQIFPICYAIVEVESKDT